MSPCAYGRYIEYINVKSKKVIVEILVLEKNIVINDKDVRTNKWLLPQHWQELYDILDSATARHIRNKCNSTLTTHGENLSVFLEFIPYVPAYMHILKPCTCNNNSAEDSFIDSGSPWLEQSPHESMVVAIVSPRYSSDYQRNSCVNSSNIGHGPKVTKSSSKSANKYSPSFVGVSNSADKHVSKENKFSERKRKTKFSNFTSREVDCRDEGSETHNSSSECIISSTKELPLPHVIPESDSDSNLPDFDFNSEDPQYFVKYSKYTGLPIYNSNPNLSEDDSVDLGTEDSKSSPSSVRSVKLTRNRVKRLRMDKQKVPDKKNYNVVVDNASQNKFEIKKSKVVNNSDIQKSQDNAEIKNELDKDCSGKWMKHGKCKPNERRDEVPKSATKEFRDEIVKSKKKPTKVRGSNKKKETNESTKSCRNTIKDYFSPKNKVHQQVELSDSDYYIETFSSSNVNDISSSSIHIEDSQDDFKSKKKVNKGKESNENKVTYEPKKNCKSAIKGYCDSVNKLQEVELLSTDCYAESANATNENSISYLRLRELKLKTTPSSAHLDNISMNTNKFNKLSRSLKTKAKKTAAENKSHLDNEPHHAMHHSNVVVMEESYSLRTKTEKTDSKHDSKTKLSRQLKQKTMLTEDGPSKNIVSHSSHSSSSSEEIITLKAKSDKSKPKSLKKNLVKSKLDSDDDTTYKLNYCDKKTTSPEKMFVKPDLPRLRSNKETTSPEKMFVKPDLPRLRSKRNNKEIKDLFGSSDDENLSSIKKISDKVSKWIRVRPITLDEQNKSIEQTPDGETKSDDLMEREKYKVSHLSNRELKTYFKRHAQYLHDLFTGRQTCERQEAFRTGGPVSRDLRFAMSAVPFKDEQLDYLLSLISEKFFRKHSFVTYYDYVMKVMLPEMTTRIFMDKFSMTEEEVLNKINTIYFLSSEPIDFGFKMEDLFESIESMAELSE